MKRIIISILAIVILSGIIFMACSKINSQSETIKATFTINSTINDLVIIRDSIGKIAFEKKIPVSELKSAYENNDTIKIQQLFGLTDKDVVRLKNRLAVLRERLLLLNPKIQKNINDLKSAHCSSCKLNIFFDHYDKYLAISVRNQNPSKLKSSQVEATEDNCQWVQYTACLILCTAGGPILYWPCAYLCICGYCTGPITEGICY